VNHTELLISFATCCTDYLEIDNHLTFVNPAAFWNLGPLLVFR